MKPTFVFDMEVYRNYILFLFKNVETKEVRSWELDDVILNSFSEANSGVDQLRALVLSARLVTFNGWGYDIPLMLYAMKGATCEQLKHASDRIIQQNLKPWNFEKEFNVKVAPPQLDHVDLMEVAPLTGSLKLYGGRLHSRSLQDLPIDPSKEVTSEEVEILRKYCENDCDTTTDLFNALKVQLALREEMSTQYGIDLRSKSDAQIAEAVIKKECETALGHKLEKPTMGPGDRFPYTIPPWMIFDWTDILPAIRESRFVVSDKGKVVMPKQLVEKQIKIGSGVYRMGIGGLHSSEQKQVKLADADHVIMDFDVVSYYPRILQNQGLYPKHIGPVFLTIYNKLVEQRLAAKKAKQKAISESLKITINGTFGKLSSKWSSLFSPDIFIQITVTGQLAILMLIERMWDIDGCEVISANTDGVTVRCRNDNKDEVMAVAKGWERDTQFELERADYASLYSRDVNSYVAVKTNGEVKAKGAYGPGLPLHKNPVATICPEAVINYLTLDASIEGTVNLCQDIRKFVSIRKITGGGIYRGQEIGRIARWYYSTLEDGALTYKVNGHKVATTDAAAPCVVLPRSIPVDLDRQWYIDEAYNLLADLGVTA